MTADQLRAELARVVAERRRNYKTKARRLAAAIIALETGDGGVVPASRLTTSESSHAPASPDLETIAAAARARADEAVAQGVTDLRRMVKAAPEWARTEIGDAYMGRTTIIPRKALLKGMLEHLLENNEQHRSAE